MATTIRIEQFKNFDEEAEDAVGTSMSGVGGISVIYQDDSDLILISGSSTPSGDYVTTDGTTPLTAAWDAEQAIQVPFLGIGTSPLYSLHIAKTFGDEGADDIWILDTLTGTLTTDRVYTGIGVAPTIEWIEGGNNLYADGIYTNIAPFGDSYQIRGGIFGAVNHQAVTMDTGIGAAGYVYNLDSGGTLSLGKSLYAYLENNGTASTAYLMQGEYISGGSSIISDFKGSSIEVSSNAGTIESAILFNGTTTATPGVIGSLYGAYLYLYSAATTDSAICGVHVEEQPGAGSATTSVSEEIGFRASLSTPDGQDSTIGELTGSRNVLSVYGNAGGAPTTTLAHGYYASLTTFVNSVVDTYYAFYSNTNKQGTITDNWGIYLTGADKNQLSGNLLIEGSSRYLNFNTTLGSTGYGFRDNSGVIEYKNSGGAWSSIVSSNQLTTTSGDIIAQIPSLTGYATELYVDTASGALDSKLTDHKSSSDHDGRYYTETELNNGQLDTRYYTETELNNGQLDTRYYTESEVNTISGDITAQLHTRSHAMTSTSDHTAGNWKAFYSNGSGQVIELALGAAGTVLYANGATSAPTFTAIIGASTDNKLARYDSTNAIQGATGASSLDDSDNLVIAGSIKTTGTSKVQAAFYAGTTDPTNVDRLNYDGYFYATRVYNAVYNDYADYQDLDDDLVFGKCYYDTKSGAKICNNRCQKSVIGVASNTYGHAVGNINEGVPIAIAGWVLAYVDKEYEIGTPLTNDANGNLTEITNEEKLNYPERIVAIYKKPEISEYWGPQQVLVDGRHWVKIK